ncbi:MAG: hypothetical protein HC869_09100 [Rhodospirillales bacterium]|nr:hypothetical protein [Rhodospirillales bacterium]
MASADGRTDYALIWDFQDGTDEIQLFGAFGDYVFSATPVGLPNGVAVYHRGDGVDELIAVISGTSLGAIGPDDFRFVPDLLA